MAFKGRLIRAEVSNQLLTKASYQSVNKYLRSHSLQRSVVKARADTSY